MATAWRSPAEDCGSWKVLTRSSTFPRRLGEAFIAALTELSSAVSTGAVTGLAPKQTYVLAFATRPDGTGTIEPLTRFTTNPADSAVINATGPIRQVVRMQVGAARRYLVILRAGSDAVAAVPVQVQVP